MEIITKLMDLQLLLHIFRRRQTNSVFLRNNQKLVKKSILGIGK